MKYKPILLKKLERVKQSIRREVIGLIGTHHGVGVTHTGLMLAFYLGEELGKKTAFVECNSHHDFRYIQRAYDWNRGDETCFSFHQITCYPDMDTEKLGRVFSNDYECIILDFGTDFISNKEELLRCSRKFIICGRSEWDRYKLLRFSERLNDIQGSHAWTYGVPQANKQAVLKIKSEVKGRVYALPSLEEPTRLSNQSIRLFQEML